jgi:hypothetical protein
MCSVHPAKRTVLTHSKTTHSIWRVPQGSACRRHARNPQGACCTIPHNSSGLPTPGQDTLSSTMLWHGLIDQQLSNNPKQQEVVRNTSS